MGNRTRTTNADIDAALKRTAEEPGAPTVSGARYHAPTEMIILQLQSGKRVGIPREDIQVLAGAPRSKVANIAIEDFGTALHWPELDLDLSVEGLLKGVTGSRRWMQELAWQRAETKRQKPGFSASRTQVLVGR